MKIEAVDEQDGAIRIRFENGASLEVPATAEGAADRIERC